MFIVLTLYDLTNIIIYKVEYRKSNERKRALIITSQKKKKRTFQDSIFFC